MTVPWARDVIAVDDTSDVPVWVRATRRLGRLRLERLPAPPAGRASAGTAIIGCLRQREGFLRWVEAPLASSRKARRVFPSLLDVQLPFPIEDCVFDIVDTRPGSDGTTSRGLAAGARAVDIERRLQQMDAAGLTPHVLDSEGLAQWTQAAEEHAGIDGQSPRAVVYESSDRLTLTVGRGTELLGAHAFKAFDADAIHRTLRLYFPEPPPGLHWLWTGPAADDKAAVKARHAALVPRWPGTVAIAADPAAFLARALATRALTPGPLRFDARQGRFVHPLVAARHRRAPVKAAAACLAAGLVLCIVNLVWTTAVSRRLEDLQANLRATAIRVAGSERLVPRGQERLGAQRAFDEQTRLLAPFLAAFQPPLTVRLESVLREAQSEGLRVQTLSATRTLITIRGTTPNWPPCERLMQRFQKQGYTVKAERKSEAGSRIPVVLSLEVPHGT